MSSCATKAATTPVTGSWSTGEAFALQLVPSGILYTHITPVIGNGVVVDPAVLLQEIDTLGAKGVDTSRLVVSGNAHLIMPYHQELDRVTERFLGKNSLGTTKARDRPAYADKATGWACGSKTSSTRRSSARNSTWPEGEERRPGQGVQPAPAVREEIAGRYLDEYAPRIAPWWPTTVAIVHDALADGRNVLLEGPGTFLDLDHGTYPFVTSSNPVAGGACTGTGSARATSTG